MDEKEFLKVQPNQESVLRFESQSLKKQATDLSLLKDILYSQDSANDVFNSKWLNSFDPDSIQSMRDALNFLINDKELSDEEKLLTINNSNNIYYKKYISPEEFLSEKCFSKETLDSIFDNVKDWFLQYWNFPLRKKNRMMFYTATRAGKSHCSALCMLYTTLLVATLRNPKMFYGVSPATRIGIILLSFNLKKAKEVLLDVMAEYANASTLFTKIKFKDKMALAEEYSRKTNKIDEIFFLKNDDSMYVQGGANVQLASDFSHFIGVGVLGSVMSELTRSTGEDAGKGWSDEYVDSMYNTMSTRIDGSYPKNLIHTGLILDSQPGPLEIHEKIDTPSGPILMKDLNIGDKVYTIDENTNEKIETEVIAIPYENEEDIYEIELGDGRIIKCSLSHEWPVIENEVRKVVNTKYLIEHINTCELLSI